MHRRLRAVAALAAVALGASLVAVGPAGAGTDPPAPPAPPAVVTRTAAANEWAADPGSWSLLNGAVNRGEVDADAAKAADGLTPAQRLRANLATFDATVTDYFTREGLPGAVVGLVADGEVIYQRALGVKKAGEDDPVDLGTLFQIGSTTKAFTSALVGTFVDDGEVRWDDYVRTHYPQFRLADEDTNVQMNITDVLSHHSGLPSYATDELWSYFANSQQELLDKVHMVQPVAPFRWQFNYQNILITVGGLVAESASGGTPYAQLVKERIFDKVGMSTAVVTYADTLAAPNVVSGHTGPVGGPFVAVPLTNVDPESPAGSIAAPLPEMLRWVRMQLGGGVVDGNRIISKDNLQATRTPHTLMTTTPRGIVGYGLCWVIQNLRAQVHWHDGSTGVNGAMVRLLPNDGIGMVVLANAAPQLLGYALSPVLEDLAYVGSVTQDYYQLIYDSSSQPREPAYPVLPSRPPSDPAPHGPLADYAGTYVDPYYGEIVVEVEDEHLRMRLGHSTWWITLQHWDGDVWADVTLSGAAVRFTRGSDGVAITLHYDFLEQPGWPLQQFQRPPPG